MAITLLSITENYAGRKASLGEDGTRIASRQWDLRLDLSAADADDRAEVEAFVEFCLPVARYDFHPGFPEAIARTVELEPNGSPDLWKAVVGYSSARFPAADGFGTPGADVGGDPVRPSATTDNTTSAEDRPPAVRTSKREYTAVLEKASQYVGGVVTPDLPVVNKAGDPYDPPLEKIRRRTAYEVTIFRTTANLHWDTRSELEDTCNDDSFSLLGKTHLKGTLLCESITKQGVWDKGADGMLTFFWEVTIVLVYEPDTWVREVMNCGRRKKITVGGTPKMVAITDDTGQPVQDPVPLTTAGDVLAAGGTVNYVEFLDHDLADWTNIFA